MRIRTLAQAPTLRVGLIGCGQIADAHLAQIRKLPSAAVVATCDVHRDLAVQAAMRFGVTDAFDSVTEMLDRSHPDVVHITTPPHTHKDLVFAALAAGAHVYVEKPFALDPAEAADMLNAAARHGRKVCVGHDQLFDSVWLECRRLSDAGELGRIVHVDSTVGYELSGPFGAQLKSDAQHWVHGLPGGLLQNTMSHALCRITDFLPDDRPRLWAHWFSPVSTQPFPSDLRVMLQGRDTTGTLTFCSTAQPVQRVARLYGTLATAEVNLDAQTLRIDRPATMRGPFIPLQLSWCRMREGQRSWTRNARRFLGSDLQFFGGMTRLIDRFYTSILEDTEPPIPPAEIQRVTRIMDDIFRACANQPVDPAEGDARVDSRRIASAVV